MPEWLRAYAFGLTQNLVLLEEAIAVSLGQESTSIPLRRLPQLSATSLQLTLILPFLKRLVLLDCMKIVSNCCWTFDLRDPGPATEVKELTLTYAD